MPPSIRYADGFGNAYPHGCREHPLATASRFCIVIGIL